MTRLSTLFMAGVTALAALAATPATAESATVFRCNKLGSDGGYHAALLVYHGPFSAHYAVGEAGLTDEIAHSRGATIDWLRALTGNPLLHVTYVNGCALPVDIGCPGRVIDDQPEPNVEPEPEPELEPDPIYPPEE